MTEIKLVVFDMAGTTVDENNVVYKTVHKAINQAGVEVDLETVLDKGAGKEKHQAIKDVLAHVNTNVPVQSETIFEAFKNMLDDAYNTLHVTPIKGVDNIMVQLKEKGVKVVLNTGYNSKIANLLLDKLGWKVGEHYDALITADDVVNGRPHPDMILKAMELTGVTNSKEVLKAGDSGIDIEEGKNANCGITIGVLSGAQTKEQLELFKPTYILNSLADIFTVLD